MKTNKKRNESLKFIELFAGVGGFRVGLNHVQDMDSDGKAIEHGDWVCSFMNQWEPSTKVQKAFDCYVARFGNQYEECSNEDISKVNPMKMPSADLLVGGFPCLPANTLILSNKGYIPIVDIKEENQVLGSDGKWHRVTKWMYQGIKETYTIHGFGFDRIQATGNHLFCIREKNRQRRKMDEPKWETVEVIKECLDAESSTLYMGVPKIQSQGIFPDWQGIDVAVNQKKIKKLCHLDVTDPTLWYLVGRYLGDGWLRKQQKTGEFRAPYSGVVICCGKHKKDKFDSRLSLNYPCSVVEEKTVFKYIFNSVELAAFLRQFGNHANKKKIPGFVYDLPLEYQTQIMEGYMDSDGSVIDGNYQISSVNRNLIYSMAHIMETVLGTPSAIYCHVPEKTKVIEGRVVQQKPVYMVRNQIDRKKKTVFYENGIFWYPIQTIEKDTEAQDVYDISVEGCHNFVANHCLVHNCQDYSVARSLNNELGIEGKKGVLFWEIARILEKKRVPFVLLENVDRLLLSPSKYRGRDFSIILKTFDTLGYNVEYRVINAGDYGMPQRRRRVFIFAYKKNTKYVQKIPKEEFDILEHGLFNPVFPLKEYVLHNQIDLNQFETIESIQNKESEEFHAIEKGYGNFGYMYDGYVVAYKGSAKEEKSMALKDVLLDDEFVNPTVYLDHEKEKKLKYLKGSKKILRHHADGTPWYYTEGAMAFPENLDLPGRTMLTSEGTVNRSSHVVADTKGKLRFLDPIEAERLQMFPDGWTDVNMTGRQRYFMMGNALVTGIISRLEPVLKKIIENEIDDE